MRFVLAGTAVALASLAFLPWFLNAQAAWQGAVKSGVRFLVTGKDLLVIPHELMGTGFIGAALTVIAIVVALGWSSWYKEEKIFWAHYAVIPLLLVPAADAYFGYFLAARQMIFVLVPISVLLAACMEVRRGAWLVPAALLLAMVYEDVHWIRRPGEGWQAAAAQLKQASCTIFVPSGARTMYVFFEPQLRVCDEDSVNGCRGRRPGGQPRSARVRLPMRARSWTRQGSARWPTCAPPIRASSCIAAERIEPRIVRSVYHRSMKSLLVLAPAVFLSLVPVHAQALPEGPGKERF